MKKETMAMLFALLVLCLSAETIETNAMDWTQRDYAVVKSGVWNNERLEVYLYLHAEAGDNLDVPHYVSPPERQKDALREYEDYISGSGWSTNQFISALMEIVTNITISSRWDDERNQVVAYYAEKALSEIDVPSTLDFIKVACTNNPNIDLSVALPRVFRYSAFEPGVVDYLQRVRSITNRYDMASANIAWTMKCCLAGLDSSVAASATNTVAKYTYRSQLQTSVNYGVLDWCLREIVPGYSNSVQRAAALQCSYNLETNELVKAKIQAVINGINALPTNELNNITWLTED